MMPTRAFDTPTKRKILRVMAEEPRKLTVEGLADSCHRSESSVSRALADLAGYPFIEQQRVEGSKRRVYGYDSSSRYTEPLIAFFDVEKARERQNGAIPVYIWNLLEDVATEMERNVETFVEVFLFGSYATGNYYTGSDVDLLLLVEPPQKAGKQQGETVIESLNTNEEIQLLVAEAEPPTGGWTREEIHSTARSIAPVEPGEPLVALHGETR